MFEIYKNYLKELDTKLETAFQEQKPYIFCKKGCSDCCSRGEYPMSRFEFLYLIDGCKSLDTNSKSIINARIKKLKKEFQKFSPTKKQPKFEHCCPFLIGNVCSIYSHRALICRTFGLIKTAKTIDGYDIAILPDCIHKGLNYSNVYNPLKNEFDELKIAKINHKFPPTPYDISLQSIYEKMPDKSIDFSDRKNLIEFLMEKNSV